MFGYRGIECRLIVQTTRTLLCSRTGDTEWKNGDECECYAWSWWRYFLKPWKKCDLKCSPTKQYPRGFEQKEYYARKKTHYEWTILLVLLTPGHLLYFNREWWISPLAARLPMSSFHRIYKHLKVNRHQHTAYTRACSIQNVSSAENHMREMNYKKLNRTRIIFIIFAAHQQYKILLPGCRGMSHKLLMLPPLRARNETKKREKQARGSPTSSIFFKLNLTPYAYRSTVMVMVMQYSYVVTHSSPSKQKKFDKITSRKWPTTHWQIHYYFFAWSCWRKSLATFQIGFW